MKNYKPRKVFILYGGVYTELTYLYLCTCIPGGEMYEIYIVGASAL